VADIVQLDGVEPMKGGHLDVGNMTCTKPVFGCKRSRSKYEQSLTRCRAKCQKCPLLPGGYWCSAQAGFATGRVVCYRVGCLLPGGLFATGRVVCYRAGCLLPGGLFATGRAVCYRAGWLALIPPIPRTPCASI
jgi:hypothetical protein